MSSRMSAVRVMVFTLVFNASAVPLAAQEVIELPAEDRILDVEFEEVYRVGAIDGDEWDVFGRVSAVGFGESGNLYVMDDQGGRIVVVSQEGEFVREFGRIGDGPGEFSASSNTAVGFTVLRDGRTVVFDPGHSAFQVFGSDGEFERSVRMPGPNWGANASGPWSSTTRSQWSATCEPVGKARSGCVGAVRSRAVMARSTC